MLRSTDLLEPKGEIIPALFPSDQGAALSVRLDLYLTQAYSEMPIGLSEDAKDEAAKHYAYWKAYESVYRRLISNPEQVVITDQGSKTYSREQIAEWKKLASDHYNKYTSITISVTSPDTRRGGSVSVPTGFTF